MADGAHLCFVMTGCTSVTNQMICMRPTSQETIDYDEVLVRLVR
jgi:hypothetical protein